MCGEARIQAQAVQLKKKKSEEKKKEKGKKIETKDIQIRKREGKTLFVDDMILLVKLLRIHNNTRKKLNRPSEVVRYMINIKNSFLLYPNI